MKRLPSLPGAQALWVLAVLAVLTPLGLDSFYTNVATQVLIFALAAMSLDILMGYTGFPSLGHAGFFGVGAYTVGLVTVRYFSNLWIVLLLGVLAGCVVSALVGILALRTRGGAFLMTTLALGQVLWAIAFGWNSVTGGDDGLPGISRPPWGLPWSLGETDTFYYLVLSIFAVASFLMWRIVKSPFGLALMGIRDSEERMKALGHDVGRQKLLAFVIAGTFAALAGGLFAYKQTFINPDSAIGLVLSAELFLMVIIGSPGTLVGPAFGAAGLVVLESTLSEYTERWEFVLGLIFVIIALSAPDGLHRALGGTFSKVRARRA
ncbi:MAG: branched-chain amino acid ABC transporter permease [Acidimicrobiaceae bacterium]|nr:branched-chain amino acid ABC transporter permease [Acidimicrobiaceae bacterium]